MVVVEVAAQAHAVVVNRAGKKSAPLPYIQLLATMRA